MPMLQRRLKADWEVAQSRVEPVTLGRLGLLSAGTLRATIGGRLIPSQTGCRHRPVPGAAGEGRLGRCQPWLPRLSPTKVGGYRSSRPAAGTTRARAIAESAPTP